MANRSRLSIAKPDIIKAFEANGKACFSIADIKELLNQNREFWRLTYSTTATRFIEFLLGATPLKEERIEFPYRPVIRFTWGEVDAYAIVQSISMEGYFSHYSAMHLHGLTDKLPKAIYFNQEQRLSGGGGTLTQKGIDNAFRGKCRTTSRFASFRGQSVYLLNGQNTKRLGVIEVTTGNNTNVQVTNLERTLIDIAVRPTYSGGVFEVAKAYAEAQGRFSVNKLVAMLKQINFTYPYHQCIGYYMKRSGLYKSNQLDLIKTLPIEYRFHLDYGLKAVDYDEEWRLFVPKGF